jgi:UDP-glucose 4-epimerase
VRSQDVSRLCGRLTGNYTIGTRRSGDVEQVYANVTKAENLLNWKAERDLEQSLRDAWRWQQAIS